MKRTASCSWRRSRRPRCQGLSPAFRNDCFNRVGLGASNDDHHADAAVEGPQHLRVVDRCFGLQPAKHRRQLERAKVDLGGKGVRQNARDVLIQPAASDMSERLDPVRLARRLGAAGAHRCASAQSSASPSVLPLANGAGLCQSSSAPLDHAPHEREAVGVHAGGGEREDHIASFEIGARQTAAVRSTAPTENPARS